MCVVSMIEDHYGEKWNEDWFKNFIKPDTPNIIISPTVTREEFDALKKEVEEMKALLKRAKIYDEQNNEPDCEVEEKMALLRKVAQAVGIDLDEVFKKT